MAASSSDRSSLPVTILVTGFIALGVLAGGMYFFLFAGPAAPRQAVNAEFEIVPNSPPDDIRLDPDATPDSISWTGDQFLEHLKKSGFTHTVLDVFTIRKPDLELYTMSEPGIDEEKARQGFKAGHEPIPGTFSVTHCERIKYAKNIEELYQGKAFRWGLFVVRCPDDDLRERIKKSLK